MKPGNRKGRPNYQIEFKRRLAVAASEAGVSVSKLAMTSGVNANMLFKWRRELRAGLFDGAPQEEEATLLPVVLAESPVAVVPAMVATAAATVASAPIEIVFADAVVRVCAGADVALLKTVFQSLRA